VGIRRVLVAVALAAFGAMAWSCNDDGSGGLTLEEYFERIDELDNEQKAKSDELEQEAQDSDNVDEFADGLEEQVQLLREFGEDLGDIDPPSVVEETHDEVVRALAAATDQFDRLIEGFREADTIEEAFASIEDTDTTEIDKAEAACVELEQIAADNDINVDLDCESEDD
jgi:hypothetical protein